MKFKLSNVDDFEDLRNKLKLDRTHSPFIVEFTGLPKSGKTIIISRLKNILESQKLRVWVVEEAATEKVDPIHRGDLLVFNMLCAIENLKNLLLAGTMRGTYDVVLMDRGIYDSIVWCEFLSASGLLASKSKNAIETFLLLEQWMSKVKMVVDIIANRDTYEARSRINSPIQRTARFNEEYFTLLGKANKEATKILNKYEEPIRPKRIEFNTTLKNATAKELDNDSYVLANSSEMFSLCAVEIADHIVREMLIACVEKIAVIESQWFDEQSEYTIDERGVQNLAQIIFGRRTESIYDLRSVTNIVPKVKYVDRQEAEENSNYLQIVSAAFILNNKKFMVLKRSISEKRKQLRGKLTLLISGHVDYEDQSLTYGGKNEIENCLLREMSEELRYYDRPIISPRFAFRMGDDKMGKRHLGFIYHVSTNSDRLETSDIPGAGDFEGKVQWMTMRELEASIDEFDPWSRLVIQHLNGDTPLHISREIN